MQTLSITHIAVPSEWGNTDSTDDDRSHPVVLHGRGEPEQQIAIMLALDGDRHRTITKAGLDGEWEASLEVQEAAVDLQKPCNVEVRLHTMDAACSRLSWKGTFEPSATNRGDAGDDENQELVAPDEDDESSVTEHSSSDESNTDEPMDRYKQTLEEITDELRETVESLRAQRSSSGESNPAEEHPQGREAASEETGETHDQRRALDQRMETLRHQLDEAIEEHGLAPSTDDGVRHSNASSPAQGDEDAGAGGTNNEPAEASHEDRTERFISRVRQEVRQAVEDVRESVASEKGPAERSATDAGASSDRDWRDRLDALMDDLREELDRTASKAQPPWSDEDESESPSSRSTGGDSGRRPRDDRPPAHSQNDGDLGNTSSEDERTDTSQDNDMTKNSSPRSGEDEETYRAATSSRHAPESRGRTNASDLPALHLEPVRIGDWQDDERRQVILRATLRSPFPSTVIACLRDRSSGDILAEDTNDHGRLQLSARPAYVPGEHEAVVEVTEPEGYPPAVWSFEVPSEGKEEESSQSEAPSGPGALSRLLGVGWALLLAVLLFVFAAGTNPLFLGPVLALAVLVMAIHIDRWSEDEWVRWTYVGVAVAGIGVLALLPSTQLIRMDTSLIGAAAVGGGFLLAAVSVQLRVPW